MVAPSLVIVTSYSQKLELTELCIRSRTPISSTSILSNPTGPRELFTIFAMEAAPITEQTYELNSLSHGIKPLPFCVRIVSPLVRSPFTANLYDSLVILPRVRGSRDVVSN